MKKMLTPYPKAKLQYLQGKRTKVNFATYLRKLGYSVDTRILILEWLDQLKEMGIYQ